MPRLRSVFTGDGAWHSAERKAVKSCSPSSTSAAARIAAPSRARKLQPTWPASSAGQVGWSFRALDGAAMRAAAEVLLGEHDFTAFRSAECQAPSPVKTLRSLGIDRRGDYWRFDFDGAWHSAERKAVK